MKHELIKEERDGVQVKFDLDSRKKKTSKKAQIKRSEADYEKKGNTGEAQSRI